MKFEEPESEKMPDLGEKLSELKLEAEKVLFDYRVKKEELEKELKEAEQSGEDYKREDLAERLIDMDKMISANIEHLERINSKLKMDKNVDNLINEAIKNAEEKKEGDKNGE